MVRRTLVVIFLLLAVFWISIPNCSPAPCFDFTPDPGFSSDEIASITLGFERFNGFIDPKFRRHLVPSGGCPIQRHDYPLDANGIPIHNGTFRAYHQVMWLGTTLVAGGYMTKVTMHELGHSAKLEHLPIGEEGIMVDAYITVEDWTEADKLDCIRVGSCSPF